MTEHVLKTWPEPFAALWDGSKSFEIRHDDRGFALGDTLTLEEWDPATGQTSGRAVRVEVSYLARDAWGLPPGLVVMGWRPGRPGRRFSIEVSP